MLSCLVFQTASLQRKEKTKGKKQRKQARERGIIWTRESLLIYRGTQSGSILGKLLVLSKPGFLYTWNEDTVSGLSDLWGGEFLLCAVNNHPPTLRELLCLDFFSVFSPPILYQSAGLKWLKKKRLCQLPPELVTSLSLSLLMYKMKLTTPNYLGIVIRLFL